MSITRSLTLTLAIGAGLAMSAAPAALAQERPVSHGGYAVVNADGTLGHHLNVVGVTRESAGVYDVEFNQPIKRCAFNATIRGDAASVVPGYIVASRHGKKDVRINTFLTLTLIPADFKFNVTATC
ncbi:MAG TPA: hypothetical protein VHC42_05310 [Rhizomicrobium sp.]|nr:hypothetical protein [Rhizomicrobium sp.]